MKSLGAITAIRCCGVIYVCAALGVVGPVPGVGVSFGDVVVLRFVVIDGQIQCLGMGTSHHGGVVSVGAALCVGGAMPRVAFAG